MQHIVPRKAVVVLLLLLSFGLKSCVLVRVHACMVGSRCREGARARLAGVWLFLHHVGLGDGSEVVRAGAAFMH